MKKLFGVLTATAVAATLASCGGDDNVVTLATWAGGTELEELQGIVDTINEGDSLVDEDGVKHTIKVSSIPSDYTMKLQTQFSAKNGPDIIWADAQQLPYFAEGGALVSIEDYYAADEKMSGYTFNEQIMGAAHYKGIQYGLPWIANPQIMYYNKSIVSAEDQAILEATNNENPTYITMDDFITMATKYTDLDNQEYGTILNGWPPVEYFVWNEGGTIQNVDGVPQFDTWTDGVNLMADMILGAADGSHGPITPDKATADSLGYTETFQAGKTAFLIAGAADGIERVGQTPLDDFEIGYAVVPVGADVQATANWTASYAMTKDADDKDMAYKAMTELTYATWEWKTVPPVDIAELGYDDYEDYLAEHQPLKEGMGNTLNNSMEITKIDNFGKNTNLIYADMYDRIYAKILNARINNEYHKSDRATWVNGLIADAQSHYNSAKA